MILICGRYEGVDERVTEHLATAEISIGNFILSGGEIAAAVVVDAVTRYVPGVVGKEESILRDSFSDPAAESRFSRRFRSTVNTSSRSGSSGNIRTT